MTTLWCAAGQYFACTRVQNSASLIPRGARYRPSRSLRAHTHRCLGFEVNSAQFTGLEQSEDPPRGAHCNVVAVTAPHAHAPRWRRRAHAGGVVGGVRHEGAAECLAAVAHDSGV